MNRRAFALGAVMLLLGSLVAVALRSFAEAAYLGAYGPAQMPWLLIANAAGFAVATLGYDAITRGARAGIVDLGLLIVLGALAGGAPRLLAAGTPPVVLVVGLAAASQVAGLALWNRAAAAVAGRDARRMLPRAGAAVTAGGAIAGLGAGALVPRLGLASIAYAGAAVTALAFVVCVAQERALVTGGAPGGVPGGPGMPTLGAPGSAAATPTDAISQVQRRLLGALIAVAVLEAIVATVIDLQFIAAVKARYSDESVAVALALFYGGTNAILFVLQTLAVPRLLVTRSLPFTAAIHPVIVVASYAGFAAAPGFLGIAGTRTADQVLRLATSRTSQELALSTLPPGHRARWKVLLRGVVWPAGAAAAALGLLALGPAALREPARLATAAIAVAVVWAITARIGARRFQAALSAPLGIRASRRDDPQRIDLDALERWTRAAGADDPKQATLARAALTRARVDASDLGDHLRHDAPEVRAAIFEQLVRDPAALRGELRAAIAIEDDDHALALGIKALALRLDDTGVTRGRARRGLSREVDEAVRLGELMLGKPVRDATAEAGELCERDPRWIIELARRGRLDEARLATIVCAAAAVPASRAGALEVIACVPHAASLPVLASALEAGEPEATAAIEAIDVAGARAQCASLGALSPLARAAAARALAGAPAGIELCAALVDDADPEVAFAALRAALAVARGGSALPAARIAAAHEAALTALVGHLDARDGSADAWSPCARLELEVATRRCVARVLWAAAVETAAAGRDPAPVAATARHLIGGREADRRRALDVIQELAARPPLLAAIERWLRPAVSTASRPPRAIAEFDAWLGRLAAGELIAIEPTLAELRRAAPFASVAGAALGALAPFAIRRRVDGELFRAGDAGDAMFVVTAGALVATRPETAGERRVEIGEVVGELAVLARTPRAATVTAVDGGAEVLAIDRAAFGAAARRAPELVLGLSATLAGWLAPSRPDVL